LKSSDKNSTNYAEKLTGKRQVGEVGWSGEGWRGHRHTFSWEL